jgi:hypothetical protein
MTRDELLRNEAAKWLRQAGQAVQGSATAHRRRAEALSCDFGRAALSGQRDGSGDFALMWVADPQTQGRLLLPIRSDAQPSQFLRLRVTATSST